MKVACMHLSCWEWFEQQLLLVVVDSSFRLKYCVESVLLVDAVVSVLFSVRKVSVLGLDFAVVISGTAGEEEAAD